MRILAGPIMLFPVDEPQFDTAVDISKRRFITTGARAAAGALVLSGAALTVACGEKISFYVSTVIGALETLSPLLPNSSQMIAKAVAIAKAFDEAYRAGKFADSVTLFTNLGDLALQIFGLAGIANPPVLLAVALARVAMNAIASILKKQAEDPTVVAAVSRRGAVDVSRHKAMIDRFADEKMLLDIVADIK